MTMNDSDSHTDVRFYHLLRQSVEQSLPALVSKALGTGKRIVIKTPAAEFTERLNEALWTFDPLSFIPHGSAKDGRGEDQSVWLTDGDENPNGASIIMSAYGADIEDLSAYGMACYMFDGNDQGAVGIARTQWKALKDRDGLSLTYWQQTEKGWEKKA